MRDALGDVVGVADVVRAGRVRLREEGLVVGGGQPRRAAISAFIASQPG